MGEPLILLPDMMSDHRLFQSQIAVLARDRAIITVPLGLHDRIDDMAQYVLACAPEQFALFGQGLGGVVAMEVLQRAPWSNDTPGVDEHKSLV